MSSYLSTAAVLIIFSTIAITACKHADDDKKKYFISHEEIKEPLIDANKIRVKKEDDMIKSYISRHKWQMKETGTGLRYQIYFEGDGVRADTGSYVVLNYKVILTDGTECYSSDKKGPKSFIIGKANVESGLEEGILLLKSGDKAKFILPSHLAYGLPGDGDKIPSYAVIIYDVELIEVK